MIIRENISLQPFNTFGIDVKARYFIEYASIRELHEVLQSQIIKENSVLHIGGGSNLLFTRDFDGIILHSNCRQISVVSETDNYKYLEVDAGLKWDELVAFCVENNLGGFENLTDIPGETGAAAVQNIGAYGVEVKDVISSVKTIDTVTNEIGEFLVDECNYGYRSSIFKHKFPGRYIITSVVFKLSKFPEFYLEYQHLGNVVKSYGEINLQNIRKAVSYIRSTKLPDPRLQGNAGSFFMNPVIVNAAFELLLKKHPGMPYFRMSDDEVKIPAAWLIEQCGWKGKSLGKVAVHPMHALIIVNTGNASASDVMNLASEIIKSVQQKFGISLQPEVIYV